MLNYCGYIWSARKLAQLQRASWTKALWTLVLRKNGTISIQEIFALEIRIAFCPLQLHKTLSSDITKNTNFASSLCAIKHAASMLCLFSGVLQFYVLIRLVPTFCGLCILHTFLWSDVLKVLLYTEQSTAALLKMSCLSTFNFWESSMIIKRCKSLKALLYSYKAFWTPSVWIIKVKLSTHLCIWSRYSVLKSPWNDSKSCVFSCKFPALSYWAIVVGMGKRLIVLIYSLRTLQWKDIVAFSTTFRLFHLGQLHQ